MSLSCGHQRPFSIVHPLGLYMRMEDHGGMTLTAENRRTRRKPVPVPVCPPQIPRGLTRALSQDLRGERPATNRLSHGMGLSYKVRSKFHHWTSFVCIRKTTPKTINTRKCIKKAIVLTTYRLSSRPTTSYSAQITRNLLTIPSHERTNECASGRAVGKNNLWMYRRIRMLMNGNVKRKDGAYWKRQRKKHYPIWCKKST
jgi:hypothetical protein